MSSEENAKQCENDDVTATTMKSPESNTPEPPYSIFDKRQKWLIIIIVSTAATCRSPVSSTVLTKLADMNSLRLRIKHLFPRPTNNRI
jgi:hypothetical protein